MKNLKGLLEPESIAVVGVSENPRKIGSVIFKNIIKSGYKGQIYPVNPKHKKLYGHNVFKDVEKIDSIVDLVIISVPSKYVKDIMKACAKKGINNVVIISAGFSEVDHEGVLLEGEIVGIAEDAGINILGPNCLGFLNSEINLNASFSANDVVKGDIAMMSQSGAMMTTLIDMSIEKNLGFSQLVSLGNKAGIDEIDLLDIWGEDDKIKTIAAYLEDIRNGDQFFNKLKEIKKPVVLLIPGASQRGKEAISSHTGSVATPAKILSTAIKQTGSLQVSTVEEMVNTLMMISWLEIKPLDSVVIITNAGGPGVVATDMLEMNKLRLAKIPDEAQSIMKNSLPLEGTYNNPIDLLGTAQGEDYQKALNIALSQDIIDAAIVIVTPQLITEIDETAEVIANIQKNTNKTVLGVFMGGKMARNGITRLSKEKIPVVSYLGDGIKALSNFNILSQKRHKDFEILDFGFGKYKKQVESVVDIKESPLSTDISMKILKEVGIQIPKQEVVYNTSQLQEVMNKIGFPMVMKPQTKDMAHKTEFKAVYVGIKNSKEALAGFSELRIKLAKLTGETNIGILVQEQITEAEEFLVGINRDGNSEVYNNNEPGFGHLILFGRGGIYTELYSDFASRLVPFIKEGLVEMIRETTSYQIIKGFRGREGLSENAIIDTLMSLQQIALGYPEVSSMDINPLFVTSDSCIAADVKIFVKK